MKTLKIAFRNVLKNKVVSSINLLGLTLGVLISLLILSYVRQEKNTDKFIAHSDNIQMFTINGDPYISKPMVELLKNNFPDMPITYFGENWSDQVYLSDNNNNKFKVKNLLDADTSFFQVFQFEALHGDLKTSLNSSNKIVLTESLAKKIFGNTNPVGKSINYNASYLDGELLQVAAVLKDLPENTSWKFDAILSIETNNKISWYKRNADNWGGQNYSACCRLMPNMELNNLKSQLLRLAKNYKKDKGQKIVEEFGIFPFTDNYFGTARPELFKHSSANTLMILQLIAVLILLMAAINYINLVSAQRQKRNKSVAIIKMLGSQRWGVVQLFMAEALIMILAVMSAVAFLSSSAIGLFNNLMSTHYTMQLFLSSSSLQISLSIFAFIFATTGIIPGLIFSRHEALKLMKPDIAKQKKSILRNILPITQFTVAITLIISLFVMKKQNDMMLNQNTGFDKEHIIFASVSRDIRKNKQMFMNELERITDISAITFADAPLGYIGQNWVTEYSYKGEKKMIQFTKMGVSSNFFDFFGIKITRGKPFKIDEQESKFIMNETAIKQYGIQDFEEVTINSFNSSKVMGVVEDFNFSSAHAPIVPIAFRYESEINNVCFIKLNANNFANIKNNIAKIEAVWNKLSPNLPLEYQFLDESWNALYKKEIQFQTMLNYAGLVSLFIACLGLFGLSVFVAERRTKEIGIRKINGANIGEILAMLNKEFLWNVVISFVIATPIAYYAMTKWLENFAYKTTLSWWIFALAGLSALIIALLTVSWQSWRAANKNPVEALRYE